MFFIKLYIPSLHKAIVYVLLFDKMAGSVKNPISQDSQVLSVFNRTHLCQTED